MSEECELEQFLKAEKRKGTIQLIKWILVLLIVTGSIFFGVFWLLNIGIRHF